MDFIAARRIFPRERAKFSINRRQVLLSSLVTPFFLNLDAHAQGDGFTQFMKVSRILTGYSDLDEQLARHIYSSLSETIPNFIKGVSDLDSSDSDAISQSPTAKAILQAWYLGVVGSGEKSSCIAYVSTLQVRVVADVLRPPTYAYGPYGSWRSKPIPA